MNRFLKPTRWLGLATLAGGMLACNAQVDPDYRGEPVATLHGTVVTSSALSAPPEISAAIVWVDLDSDAAYGFKPRFIGDRIDVQGDFPASFELSVYAAPPPEATQVIQAGTSLPDGSQTTETIQTGHAWGFIAAIDSSADAADIHPEDIIGIDPNYSVRYFEHDVTPRPHDEAVFASLSQVELLHESFHNMLAAGLHVPTEAGYHITKVNPAWTTDVQALNDCKWQAMCVHWTSEVPEEQGRMDWDFERCTQRFPENRTCSALMWGGEDGSEPASSSECREMYEILVPPGSCDGIEIDPEHYVTNPDDLDAPIRIELGMGLFDVGQ